MKRSKWIPILICAVVFGLLSGCKPLSAMLPQKPVYIGPAQICEVAWPVKVNVWITNKATGKREMRQVRLECGYFVGRPPENDKARAVPQAKESEIIDAYHIDRLFAEYGQ